MTEGEAIRLASKLAGSGRHAEAKEILLSVRERVEDWPEDLEGFSATRTLARCYRAEHDFNSARNAIMRAVRIARAIGSAQGEAVALEGAGNIEREAGRIQQAGRLFVASAAVEGQIGNLEGRAAALSNYANMLINHDIEGAEQLLQEALQIITPDSRYYPLVVDNLAGELHRQGRYEEAVEYSEAAVAGFASAGRPFDAYTSLQTLARILAGAGRAAESVQAFTQAHNLIRDLRRAEVNAEHYAKYRDRVRDIEANCDNAVKNSPRLEALRPIAKNSSVDPVSLLIGIHATAGKEAQEEGMRQLEEGRFSEAIDSLLKARRNWEELQARHMLVTVDYHLALAFAEVGDREMAVPVAFAACAAAHQLGDAFRESMALSLLAWDMMTGVRTERDGLDYLLSADALQPYAQQQLNWQLADVPTDVGALAMAIANCCASAHAYDLAEHYYFEAIRIARQYASVMGYRFVYRLSNFHEMLRNAGRVDQAAEVLTEMRSVAVDISEDPRVARAVASATSRGAFASGVRTREVLDGLLAECLAFEALRDNARGLDLAGFSEAHNPPYSEAAQVALALGETSLALGLLERGTARTLLEAIQADDLSSPRDPVELPSIGDRIAVAAFAAKDTITLLVWDGVSGRVTQSSVHDADPPLRQLIQAFTDAADAERQGAHTDGALDAIMAHPTFGLLSEAIAGLVPPERKASLVPYGYLSYMPWQLLPPPARRYPIVPSVTVAAQIPPMRPVHGTMTVVSCGDSLGDLPFARAEARLIANASSIVAVGADSTLEWLEEALNATPHARATAPSILHIACHGRFDRMQPSRSGIILAAPAQNQLAGTSTARLVNLPQIARLPLSGMIVVLSACSSGMEAVRAGETSGLVSALLSAGAASVVAAQWPVSDLTAMLLMTQFYEQLARHQAQADLLASMDSAAAGVRDMTVDGLIDYGFRASDQLSALGAPPEEAVGIVSRCLSYALEALGDRDSAALAVSLARADFPKEAGNTDDWLNALRALRPAQSSGALKRPFTHPRYWGAFKIVGRTAEGI